MPLISVITAVYNNEKYVRNAINSVLNQTFDSFEYIIIDDGSTDNTPYILDEIAANDNRVHVIHQSNQWIYASFNNGVKEARGEYVFILNSDDTIETDVLNNFYEIIKQYNPDVIYTPVLIHKCDANQNIIVYDRLNFRELVKQDVFFHNKNEVRDNWVNLNKLKLVTNQANLYRRNLMLSHPFRNDVYGADYLFNISIADDIETAYVMKRPVYNFFEYDCENMNTSVNKYYEYEHYMFNEFYYENQSLLKTWKRYNFESDKYCLKKRLSDYSHELRSLTAFSCNLTLEEKLKKILNEYIEPWICKEVQKFDLEEEFEARTLSGIRGLFYNNTLSEDSDMYFLYELLDSLLRYEKTEHDYARIKNAVYNENNPLNIGKIFYQKIKNGERFS